jgi:hypothetical protein
LPAALKVGPDVEGAEFLVGREGADPVAELGWQLREEGDTTIGAAILCIVDCVVGLWCD